MRIQIPYKAKRSATTENKEFPEPKIGKTAKISETAIIYKGAVIGENVFIADNAVVREGTIIGDETIVGSGVIIENDCIIGSKCKIESRVYICAYSTVEDYCFIAPGVLFTNDSYIGRDKERLKHFKGPHLKKGARIGAGAIIFPNITIGEDSLIGAGSVVTKDTEPRMIYYGSPAKKIRKVPEEQLLENNF